MKKIIWSDIYNVGSLSIDGQHKKIIDLINILIDYHNNSILSRNITDLYEQLLNLSYNHFDFEETLLCELNYPEKDLQQHIDIHLTFKVIVTELVLKSITRNNEQVSPQILRFLKDWWLNHILKEDMKYKSFLEEGLK